MATSPTVSTTTGRLAARSGIVALWLQYRVALIAACVTLLGVSLRLFDAGAASLRLDEVWTLWLARQNIGDVVRKILFEGVDSTPPTYYLFVHPFLTISQDPVSLRLVTIIAGTITVLVTFQLALYLFDLKVASVAGLLMALAPMHIEYSQVARAYALASLWSLISIYFFARFLFGEHKRWYWLAFVLVTAAMLLTFYLTALVVLFENMVMAFLWIRHRLSRETAIRWVASQVAIGLFIVPVSFAIFINIGPNTGHDWLARPNLASLVKTAILFTTGDPSEGPTGFTIARGVSVLVIMSILALAAKVVMGRARLAQGDARRALFVLSAAAIPWALSFAVSQKSSIYHEKYLLFIIPCLLVLIAWVLVRSAHFLVSPVAVIALLTLTVMSLVVYYTTPSGEQWREAINYMKPRLQANDTVLISPGYYAFPFAYYLSGRFPDDIRSLAHKPVVEAVNSNFSGVDLSSFTAGSDRSGIPNTSADGLPERVWIVYGYTSPEAGVSDWLQRNFTVVDTGKFVGAQVVLMQRIRH